MCMFYVYVYVLCVLFHSCVAFSIVLQRQSAEISQQMRVKGRMGPPLFKFLMHTKK